MDDRIESSNLNIEASHLNSDMNLAGGDGLAAVQSLVTQSAAKSIFSKVLFQRILILSLTRLIVYINKLYQDFGATHQYKDHNEYNFFMLSLVSLIAPPIVYTLFLVGSNLAKEDRFDVKEVGTKAVNGILLIPWQIKRHLDVLYYAAQRVCHCRPPNQEEIKEMKCLKTTAQVMEFFEDFYAGFLQIIMQLYILLGNVEWMDSLKLTVRPIMGELYGSILCVISMMIAVRRRDDGLATHFLSFFGWLSLMSSRVLVFALAASVIHSWLLVLCLIHILVFSLWIYNIAIESYGISTSSSDVTNKQWSSKRKRSSIGVMVFFLFGIPSLLIWPIMFQLREGRRPLIFLLVTTIENLCLLGVWLIWLMINEGSNLNNNLVALTISIVLATLIGDLFLSIYVFCKPKYTDQVVLYKIRETRNADAPTLEKLDKIQLRTSNAFKYGIFYEFCDLVFKLPSTHKIATDLQELREQELI